MRIEAGKVLGGLKMANGENPKGYGRRNQAPYTRMKVAALQREQFLKARDYQKKGEAYRKAVADGKKDATPPDTDPALEPLVEVLQRKRTVHFHSHRADDLMTALRIAEEFDFEIVMQHGTEGYRIADELAKRKVPASLTLVDSPGGKLEVVGLIEENAAILEKAGVNVAINTDDSVTESRFFLRTGAIALRGGMSEDSALRALTINGARMLHLEDRVGSLEKGKDADFVVLSGAPFSVYTQVLETWIDGVKRFDRSRQKDWTYQAGGFALADPERLPKTPALLKPWPEAKAPATPADAPPMKTKPVRVAVLAGRIHTVGKGTITDGAILIEDGKVTLGRPARRVQAAGRDAGADRRRGDAGPDRRAHRRRSVGQTEHQRRPGPGRTERPQPGRPARAGQLQSARAAAAIPARERRHRGPRRAGPGQRDRGPERASFAPSATPPKQMTVRFPAGLLVNLGEVPKNSYSGKLPLTRMGTANLVRNAFAGAESYVRKQNAKDEDKRPARNLKSEGLALALERQGAGDVRAPSGRRHWHGPATDEGIQAANAAAPGHGRLPGRRQHRRGRGAGDRASDDAARRCHDGDVQQPTLQRRRPGGPQDPAGAGHVLRGLRSQDARPAARGGDGGGQRPRIRPGVAPITLDAAHILGIDEKYGSIEVGKVADLVLYDGDPFEHATHVTYTVMEGRVVFDRAEYLKLPFARRALPLIGGDGVGCCLGEW